MRIRTGKALPYKLVGMGLWHLKDSFDVTTERPYLAMSFFSF